MLFRIIAVTEMAAFYICYFAKMILQKKKGIQTDQMGKMKVGFTKFIEITLKLVTCIVPVIELISIFVITPILGGNVRWFGTLIGCLGVIVFIISVVTMKDSWRAGVPETNQTELVTSGIYQISRNPAFLGFDLLYIGILWMFFNWLLFSISTFAIVMFHLQIVNVEEEFLIKSFGEDYMKYKEKVNRYLGRKR